MKRKSPCRIENFLLTKQTQYIFEKIEVQNVCSRAFELTGTVLWASARLCILLKTTHTVTLSKNFQTVRILERTWLNHYQSSTHTTIESYFQISIFEKDTFSITVHNYRCDTSILTWTKNHFLWISISTDKLVYYSGSDVHIHDMLILPVFWSHPTIFYVYVDVGI